MARRIQVKRGPKANLPELDVAELGYVTDDNELYVGALEGNLRIASEKDLDRVDNDIEAVTEQLAQTAKLINVSKYINNSLSDDSEAINKAINDTPANGILKFDDIGRTYLVGDLSEPFLINKPMTIISDNGVWIKLKDQSNLFHSGGRTSIFRIISSDVTVDGLNIDGNSRNNYKIENGIKVYYAVKDVHASYPNGVTSITIDAGVTGGDITVTNTMVRNCRLMDASSSTLMANGGIEELGVFDENTVQCVDGVVFENNTVSEGQRSVIIFTSGVKNGIMRGNIIKNCYYVALKLYIHTLNCSIHNNTVYGNSAEIDATKFVSDSGYPIESQGIGVGHGSRAPGSCKNTSVLGNTLKLMGNFGDADAISIGLDVPNCFVSNNLIEAPACYSGVRLRTVGNDVTIANNQILNSGVHGIQVVGSVNKRINIINNYIYASNRRGDTGSTGNISIHDNVEGVFISGNFLSKHTDNKPNANILLRSGTLNNKVFFNEFLDNVDINYAIINNGNNLIQGRFNNTVNYGNNNSLSSLSNVVALGSSITANAVSVALGREVNTSGLYGIGIGFKARATGQKGIAIGHNSNAALDGGVAIGSDSYAVNANDFVLGSVNHNVKIPSKALYLKSPNNTEYKITVNDDGTIQTTQV